LRVWEIADGGSNIDVELIVAWEAVVLVTVALVAELIGVDSNPLKV
jgi:hypothetical protein